MRLVVHPAARLELDAALARSSIEFGPGTAARLRLRFDRSGLMLLRHPTLGTPAGTGARKLPMGRFPYTLVYRLEGELIHVIALMHQSRRPDYWRAR
jgi:plasmid stabilization system protein ParE